MERSEMSVETAFEWYRPALLRQARGILNSHTEAEEVVQETYVKLWRNLYKLTPEGLPRWLSRVTTNGCIDALRSRKVREAISLERLTDEYGDFLVSRDGEVPTLRAELETELCKLRPEARALICLLYLTPNGPRTLGEAAFLLGYPPATARTWLQRGRKRLRVLMERPLPPRREKVVHA